jgi:GNAT superfamily N-acetyltransferase
MAAPTIPPQPVTSPRDAVTVRPARPGDEVALTALVGRCSELTLYRRFHGATGPHVRREIDRIAHPTPTHRSWVGVGPGAEAVGTATLARGRDGDVHVAFLVGDAWQRRGIGRALYTALAPDAVADGFPAVTATILGDNVPALRFLQAIAPRARSRFVDGEVVVRVPVRSRAHRHPQSTEVAA